MQSGSDVSCVNRQSKKERLHVRGTGHRLGCACGDQCAADTSVSWHRARRFHMSESGIVCVAVDTSHIDLLTVASSIKVSKVMLHFAACQSRGSLFIGNNHYFCVSNQPLMVVFCFVFSPKRCIRLPLVPLRTFCTSVHWGSIREGIFIFSFHPHTHTHTY